MYQRSLRPWCLLCISLPLKRQDPALFFFFLYTAFHVGMRQGANNGLASRVGSSFHPIKRSPCTKRPQISSHSCSLKYKDRANNSWVITLFWIVTKNSGKWLFFLAYETHSSIQSHENWRKHRLDWIFSSLNVFLCPCNEQSFPQVMCVVSCVTQRKLTDSN